MSANEPPPTAQALEEPQAKTAPKPPQSIILRSPSHGSEPSPPVHYTATHWALSHTSRAGWKTQRNALFKFTIVPSSGTANSSLDQTLEISYAAKSGSSRETEMVGSKWEVLAERRYGALEDWMIETEYGIEDSSGKRIFYCIAFEKFHFGSPASCYPPALSRAS